MHSADKKGRLPGLWRNSLRPTGELKACSLGGATKWRPGAWAGQVIAKKRAGWPGNRKQWTGASEGAAIQRYDRKCGLTEHPFENHIHMFGVIAHIELFPDFLFRKSGADVRVAKKFG